MTSVRDIYPSWDKLNFTADCDAYGQWLSSYVQPNRFNASLQLEGSLPLAVKYFVSALPKGWRHPNADTITVGQGIGQIAQWFAEYQYHTYDEAKAEYLMDVQFYNNVVMGPKEKCAFEFCKAIGYTGNADLSGIGVIVSYYVESILTTLYLVAFTVWQTKHYYKQKAMRQPVGGKPRRAKTFAHTATTRLLDAFRGSLDGFLANAMLLSTVMLIAALYVAVAKFKQREDWSSEREVISGSFIYDIVLSLLAATFSVFPVMVVYALMRHPEKGQEGNHRKWLRRVMLFVMWCLGVTEVYLAPRGELDYDNRHTGEEQFFCDQRGGVGYWQGLKASQFLVVGAPLLWIVLTVFILTGFWIPGVKKKQWVRRWRDGWRLTVAWVNLLAMWGLLAYITILRRNIRKAAGYIDQDSKWGFGQILALATWVPVAAEFMYILFFGLEDGLSGNLPPEYKAVLREQPGLEVVSDHFPTPPPPPSNGATPDYKVPLMDMPTRAVSSTAPTLYDQHGGSRVSVHSLGPAPAGYDPLGMQSPPIQGQHSPLPGVYNAATGAWQAPSAPAPTQANNPWGGW